MQTFKVGDVVSCVRPELGRRFLRFGAKYEVVSVPSEYNIVVAGSTVAFLNNRFVKHNSFRGNLK